MTALRLPDTFYNCVRPRASPLLPSRGSGRTRPPTIISSCIAERKKPTTTTTTTTYKTIRVRLYAREPPAGFDVILCVCDSSPLAADRAYRRRTCLFVGNSTFFCANAHVRDRRSGRRKRRGYVVLPHSHDPDKNPEKYTDNTFC